MDYARKAHNGALIHIQQFSTSPSADDLVSAVILSGRSSSLAQDCVVEASDVLSYGPDAVKMVKANNYIMAYYFHEVLQETLGDKQNQINFNHIVSQYKDNVLWMAKMLEIDENKIRWLWGTITMQDVASVLALIQYFNDDSDWRVNDSEAEEKSLLRMISREYFDLNCFKTNGVWNFFK